MNKELEKLKKAMDAADFDKARELADTYVQAHPDEFNDFAELSIESVVQAVDVFRAAGMTDNQYRAEAWHLYKWAAQEIGAAAAPTLRIR